MQKFGKESRSKAVAGFSERMSAGAAAKKALLEKWRSAAIDVNDPSFLQQQAIRQASAAAKLERDRQRKAEKDAAKAKAIADRLAAQKAAALQRIADDLASATAESEAALALIALEAQRKALRDARYAARKAGKK